MWIETLYFNCNAIDCDTIHSPGESLAEGLELCPSPLDDMVKNCEWSNTLGPDNVEGMLAFNIPLPSLPDSIRDFFPGVNSTREYALTR